MSQDCHESRRQIIKNVIQKHRSKFSALQEASFERGEKQLLEILGDDEEVSTSFPIPGFFIGILVWLFIILFPLIIIAGPRPNGNLLNATDLLNYYVPLFATLIIFLVNQRFVVPKLFFRRKYFLFLLVNALMLFAVLSMRELLTFMMVRTADESWSFFITKYAYSDLRGHFSISVVLSFFAVEVMVCAVCILISMFARQIIRAFIVREKRRATLQYELDFLKSQLSPHFLFNTLNNITSLISFDPKLAESSMTKLSQLLRVMLYQTGDKYITIKEEADILKKYAELEKLRLDESFDFAFDVEIENPNVHVEPLLFMPLMENAMKHCVNPKGKSFAHVVLRQQGDEIFIKVENSNFPRKSSKNSGGLGLTTLKKRLELRYEGMYRYETRVENETYIAELSVKVKNGLDKVSKFV
ncbi:sensor histidine kinase [Fibrobacter sp. UWEL]|uniref:sensor histidine kinase n=1 Tax=Fibrobacter sp. UWEL TaxID=1896209 RepID=UPI000921DC98|nr:histidine kinase [Fibrobacter sp. UWEL]SHL10525.1 Histidine kinase [Fibrobacter sp. UWEL]